MARTRPGTPAHAPLYAALVLAAGLAGSAYAQCDVYRPYIPDFDQRREAAPGIFGLPNDGSSHCVPSSVCDFVAYIYDHGAPGLMFNQEYDFADPSSYNIAGALIGYTGWLMGTTSGGTGYSGFVSGMTEFFNDRMPDQFVCYTRHWHDGDDVSPEMAYDAMLNGGFVVCGRGTYQREEGTNVFARTGGHALAINHVYDACSSSPEFGLRDPNSSDSRFVQSPWTTYSEHLEERLVELRRSEHVTYFFSPWVFSNDYGPDTLKVLDGLRVIMPCFGLTEEAIEGRWTVRPIRPFDLTGPIRPTHGGARLPAGVGRLTGIQIEPGTGNALVLTTGEGQTPAQAFSVRPGTGDVTPLMNLPHPAANFCWGDGHVFFAVLGNTLAKISKNSAGRYETSLTYDLRDTIVSSMAYDADDDVIDIIVSSGAGGSPHVKVFDGRTLEIVEELPFPSGVRFDGPTGMAIGQDGTILCCSSDVPSLFRLARTRQGLQLLDSIVLPPDARPCNPVLTDSGRLIYTDRGSVVELERNSAGAWTPNGRLYVGVQVGAFFTHSTSRGTIADSELPGAEEWTEALDEILPGQRPDCAADFNGDGQADFFDYLDFVAAFEAQDWKADFNEDNLIDFFDYLDFAAAFERGC